MIAGDNLDMKIFSYMYSKDPRVAEPHCAKNIKKSFKEGKRFGDFQSKLLFLKNLHFWPTFEFWLLFLSNFMANLSLLFGNFIFIFAMHFVKQHPFRRLAFKFIFCLNLRWNEGLLMIINETFFKVFWTVWYEECLKNFFQSVGTTLMFLLFLSFLMLSQGGTSHFSKDKVFLLANCHIYPTAQTRPRLIPTKEFLLAVKLPSNSMSTILDSLRVIWRVTKSLQWKRSQIKRSGEIRTVLRSHFWGGSLRFFGVFCCRHMLFIGTFSSLLSPYIMFEH